MPQIGWFELLIIVIIAVLVIGPKDFPIVLKKIGTWLGSFKRYFSDIKSDINKITSIDEEDTKSNIKIDKKKEDE